MVVLDPVALRVKRDLDKHALPAFVESRAYDAFIKERFPLSAEPRIRDTKQGGGGLRGTRKEAAGGGLGAGGRRSDGKQTSFKGGILRRMSVGGAKMGTAARTSMQVGRGTPTKGARDSNRSTLRATLNAGRTSGQHAHAHDDADAASALARQNLREKLANMSNELEEIERRDSMFAVEEARTRLSGGQPGGKRTTEHAALAATLVKANQRDAAPQSQGCTLS